MSIGKSSIARAVNATATKPATTQTNNVITKFSLDSIGLLSIAQVPEDIENIKASISKRGVLCPILVAVTSKNDVWLIDGYRRFYTAKELGISELSAMVINAENKTEVNKIYTELSKAKSVIKEIVVKETSDTNIHEEKFRVIHVKDHDLPIHLL